VQIALSPEMSAFIAARVTGYSTETPERMQWLSPFVANFAALPLYVGWTETIGIRPSGEMVRWSTEGDYQGVKAVNDSKWVLSALVAGAERHSELLALLPRRPPGALDCECRSHPLFVSGKLLCGMCGGVGWLLADSLPRRGAAKD